MRISWVRQSATVMMGALILIILACSVPPQSRNGQSTDDVADRTVAVPEFSISVKLTEMAEKRRRSAREEMKVVAYFDGDPLPGQGKYNAPMRDVVLGGDEKFVDAKNVATFGSTKISQSNWNRLSDKNYFVTINVVSARKTSRNLLDAIHDAFRDSGGIDCGSPEGRISTFAGKATDVSCRMFHEP